MSDGTDYQPPRSGNGIRKMVVHFPRLIGLPRVPLMKSSADRDNPYNSTR